MILNGSALLLTAPIYGMVRDKTPGPGGVSYGLSEGGYDLRIAQTVTLYPMRRFRLASTVERFDMPSNLLGVVHDKSTWARRKLSVFNTIIEPGWHGFLTLELVYHGWWPLRIPAGSGIAQVVFHELREPADYGNGKYQGQGDHPVAARSSRVPAYLAGKP